MGMHSVLPLFNAEIDFTTFLRLFLLLNGFAFFNRTLRDAISSAIISHKTSHSLDAILF